VASLENAPVWIGRALLVVWGASLGTAAIAAVLLTDSPAYWGRVVGETALFGSVFGFVPWAALMTSGPRPEPTRRYPEGFTVPPNALGERNEPWRD